MRLPLKLLVLNNSALAFVQMEMEATGFLDTAVELTNLDFAAMAPGGGIFAKHVEDPAELGGAMREWLAHDGPALLDVMSARQDLPCH